MIVVVAGAELELELWVVVAMVGMLIYDLDLTRQVARVPYSLQHRVQEWLLVGNG